MGDAEGSDRREATDGAGLDGATERGSDEPVGERADPAAARPRLASPTSDEFGWRGWVLVSVIVVSFLVVPGILVALASQPSLAVTIGLSFQDAYLALPMIPAILLAITAVWAALHARRR